MPVGGLRRHRFCGPTQSKKKRLGIAKISWLPAEILKNL